MLPHPLQVMSGSPRRPRITSSVTVELGCEFIADRSLPASNYPTELTPQNHQPLQPAAAYHATHLAFSEAPTAKRRVPPKSSTSRATVSSLRPRTLRLFHADHAIRSHPYSGKEDEPFPEYALRMIERGPRREYEME